MENENRSLDLTEVLSKIHKQAVLVGGPHDGKRAPLPPLIYGDEHPRYICQPGRPFDETWYHYRHTTDTTYVYTDHCNTLPAWPHNPQETPDEQERSVPERWLFGASATVVLGASALAVGFTLSYILSALGLA